MHALDQSRTRGGTVMATETFRDGGYSVDITAGGGELEVTPVDLSGGSSECHLHIPHKSAGAELVQALKDAGVGGPAIESALRKMDENWQVIERHWAYYIAHCRCRCEGRFTGNE